MGRGGGAEHLLLGIFCTFSWIALSFFEYEEALDSEESKCGTRNVNCGCCRKISEDRETMQKHSEL